MIRLSTLVLLAITAVLVLPAAPAAAQSTWPAQRDICGGYDDAEFGSGQMDAAGRLYLPCSESVNPATGQLRHDNHIGIYNHAGVKEGRIGLGFDRDGYNWRATSVAPSPDGAYVYAIRRSDLKVYRFVRQGDGSYIANSQAEWRLTGFPLTGGATPAGVFLATDGAGNIYLSWGRWCDLVNECYGKDAIIKFAPSGAYTTHFGVGRGTAPGQSAQGYGGIAVTADGTRVFTTDPLNSRIQRFDRQPDGSYAVTRVMESSYRPWGVPEPACFADGRLAAPYDVKLTPGGELIAINTSCNNTNGRYGAHPRDRIELQRFSQDGAARGSVLTTSHRPLDRCDADPNCGRVHGIAISRSGKVHLVQAFNVVTPTDWADMNDKPPLGGTSSLDAIAPTITAATIPATTATRQFPITLAATDNVSVTHMQLTLAGATGDWTPYSNGFGMTLPDRPGVYTFTVKVRDAAGNESALVTRTITLLAPAAPGQPAPAPTPGVNPARPVVNGGGGSATPKRPKQPAAPARRDRTAPVITRVRIPVQIYRGRSARVRVHARGGAVQVRYSVANGRWGKWRSIKDARPLVLPKGAGWKPVFTQVRDRSGNRSKVWFHTVFVASKGSSWVKGTAKRDIVRRGRGSRHIDVSNFDGKVDRVTCSNRRDTVLAQPDDIVARSCRNVTRIKMPRW